MAVMRVCDLCKGHPLDYDAKSGGDVRAVTIDIAAEESAQVGAPPEHYNFDACGPCRHRIMGEVIENFALGPPTATAVAVNSHTAAGSNRLIQSR